jgi:ligand-binding sensor domain-containing protein
MRAGIVLMMSRWLFALILIFSWVFFSNESVAGIGAWKNFTSMKSVRAVAADGKTIWAATSGGVFRFDPVDSTYQKFVNSDGLSTNNVTAVFTDSTGLVWIGHQSGYIDVFNSKNSSWKYVTDVAMSGKTNRAINSFFRSGDKMYIATAFGIAVFSITKFEFSDTYTNFGDPKSTSTVIQPNISSVYFFQNRVFASTNSGIVTSKASSVNLAAPESWEFLSPVTTGNTLAQFNGSLFVSTASGLMKFQTNAWTPVSGLLSGVKIISALDTSLLCIEGSTLKSLNTNNTVSVISSSIPAAVSCGAILNGKVFLGFETNGIGTLKNASIWELYIPNGPNSNAFYQLVMDEKGVLWSASGQYNSGYGFYSFDGTKWRNYTTANTPALLNNDCFAVSLGPNNSKWISTWGDGLILVNGNGDVVKRFDYTNPGFIGPVRSDGTGLPSYIVPSKVATDRSGNVWVSSYLSVDNKKVLWKMKPDSTWESFSGSLYGPFPSFMFGICIDQNQTKWFTNSVHGGASWPTIVYYNEGKNIPGTTDGWGTITEEDGATNLQTETMVVDKEGDLWIGTGTGITIITDVSSPKSRVSKVFLGAVRDQYINCIAVDPLNNKWVATSTGVFVLSPDGTQLLQQYNVEISGGKMLDDNVLSIAFDTKNGIAFLGTEKGLSSVEIAAVAIKNSFSTIDLAPNPVYLPDHSSVEIRGLVDESTIKVLTLNGKVLKQFAAQGGGRAFWDCKDSEGRMVASGVYIIVAHNRAGDQVASAKVAVIRK